ncbi:hypothetical protein D3C85_1502570 [compost metagenome]
MTTLAGESALEMNVPGSSDQRMMSIFSFLSSLTIPWMRPPREPTQAPTGSTEASRLRTAILVR